MCTFDAFENEIEKSPHLTKWLLLFHFHVWTVLMDSVINILQRWLRVAIASIYFFYSINLISHVSALTTKGGAAVFFLLFFFCSTFFQWMQCNCFHTYKLSTLTWGALFVSILRFALDEPNGSLMFCVVKRNLLLKNKRPKYFHPITVEPPKTELERSRLVNVFF